jgi:hypothetical protein
VHQPRRCADGLIPTLLGIKTVFHLPRPALQGFAQSLHELASPLGRAELHDALPPCANARCPTADLPRRRLGALPDQEFPEFGL